MHFKRLYILILIAILTLFCKEKAKNEIIKAGVITFLTGKAVIIKKDNTEIPVKKDLIFQSTDTIETKENSNVDLYLTSGVQIRIKSNTKIKIQELEINQSQNQIRSKILLEKGRIFTKSPKKLTSTSSFTIVTPTYTAGIRGTEFQVIEEGSIHTTQVLEGSVEVKQEGKKEEVIEEGKKGNVEGAEIKIQELSKNEIQELKDDSTSFGTIRDEYNKSLEEMLKNFDETREKMREQLIEFKEKNNSSLEEFKNQNNSELENKKNADKQLLEENKNSSKQEIENLNSKAKQGIEEIKNKTKEELDQERKKTGDSIKDSKDKLNSSFDEEKKKLKNPQ
jgi:F0F1-type ATP synthase membrane subunit b/b'